MPQLELILYPHFFMLDGEPTMRVEELPEATRRPSPRSTFCVCTTILLLHGRFPIHAVNPGNR